MTSIPLHSLRTSAVRSLPALAAALFHVAIPAAAQAPPPLEERTIDWAEARKFWAFQPPRAHARPRVRRTAWPRKPLDYFILARLEGKRLAPSPEADRRTLIRRITFDLTGLPPTPEEVEAFAADRRPDAYAEVVQRLLASPRFGERMASFWLPLARYAGDQAHQVGSDTKFFYPNAHLYRDWVIQAFNRDLPYDRFARLQLAADRIDGADKADLAALGFLGLGPKYYNRNRIEVLASEWEDRVDTVTRTFLGLTVACARCHDHKFDPITTRDYYALAGVFAGTKMVNKSPDGAVESPGTDAAKMRGDTLHVVEEDAPKDLNVFIRGNVESKGPLVHRRFLRVLSADEPAPFRDGSGRKDLAEAIADPNNPLTARVAVNRLWGLLFGRPLVGTASNFGRIGELPTHPELLDDLAVRFRDGGWSVKALVREIVLSSAYRQASRTPSAVSDPTNSLLGRMNRRRLTIEQWRDAVLSVTGRLELGAGPAAELDDPANRRRTVHARVSRLKLNDLLLQFDYPDANVHAEKRTVTNTPMQKLFVLNNPFMMEQARTLAERVKQDSGESVRARVERAYHLLFARPPDPTEISLALAFLGRPAAGDVTRWEQYAQMLLATNEMLYLD